MIKPVPGDPVGGGVTYDQLTRVKFKNLDYHDINSATIYITS